MNSTFELIDYIVFLTYALLILFVGLWVSRSKDGKQKNAEDNIYKLLDLLKNKPNRKAQFRTIIALIIDGKEYVFEGIVKGEILEKKRGDKGFGYDPVFLPEEYDQSFAELPFNEKNKISHRALALKKLNKFLNEKIT